MKTGLRIAFFGSSLVSCYWNGAATYYRGLLRALHGRGHHSVFYEPDAFQRQQHRDMADPDWAEVVVYPASEEGVAWALAQARARQPDVVVKASGVGVFDAWLEREVLSLASLSTAVVFWDVDAPATLARLQADPADPLRPLIPRYDMIFTYGGGPPVVDAYRHLGARDCVPIYNALDPDTHYPVPPQPAFTATLTFLGNRLPDREARVAEFFFKPARLCHADTFLLGGSGWHEGIDLPANVRYLGHVYSRDHNAFNASPNAVLNINRASMASGGYSPPTRIFEAAGAGACIISDAWPGIECFLQPEQEVLIAASGEAVAEHITRLDGARARRIGQAALARVRAEHTYARRAAEVEAWLVGRTSRSA